MGIWDRFGQGTDARSSSGAQPSVDDQAIERYRYMLRTAPPEAIEQAHAEAFAQLTAEQRRRVLEELKAQTPEFERASAARASDSPDGLARLATRAEIRQPGTIERIFAGVGRNPAGSNAAPGFGGLGGMLAGSFLASMAGTVLGSMVAQHFFNSHPEAQQLFGAGGDALFDHPDSSGSIDPDLIDTVDDDPDIGSGDGGTFDI